MTDAGLRYVVITDGMTPLVDYNILSGECTAASQEQIDSNTLPVTLSLHGNQSYLDLVRSSLAQLAPFATGQATHRESSLVIHSICEDKGMCYLCIFDITDVSSNPTKAYKFLKRLRKLFTKQHEVVHRPADPLIWGAVPSFALELSQQCIKETVGRGRSSSIAVSTRSSDAGLEHESPGSRRHPLTTAGHRRRHSRSETSLASPPSSRIMPGHLHLGRTSSTPLLVRASHASANMGIPADTLAQMMNELGVSNFHDADSFAHVTESSQDSQVLSSEALNEMVQQMKTKKAELVEGHKQVQYSPVPVTDKDRMEHISLLRQSMLRLHDYDTLAMKHQIALHQNGDATTHGNSGSSSNSNSSKDIGGKHDTELKFVRQSLLKHAMRLHEHFFSGPGQNGHRDGLVDVWGLPFILQSTSTLVHIVDCLVTVTSTRIFTNDESTWIDAIYTHPIGSDAYLHSFEVTINGVETHTTLLQSADVTSIFHTDYWVPESSGVRDGLVRFLIRDLPPKAEVRITTSYSKRMRPATETTAIVFLGSLVPRSALIRPEGDTDRGLSLMHQSNAALNIYMTMPGEIEHVDLGHDNTVYRQDGQDPSKGILSLSTPLSDTAELYLSVHCRALSVPRAWYTDNFKMITAEGHPVSSETLSTLARRPRIAMVVCPASMAPSPHARSVLPTTTTTTSTTTTTTTTTRTTSNTTVPDTSAAPHTPPASPGPVSKGPLASPPPPRPVPTSAIPSEWVLVVGTAFSPADLRMVTEGVHLFLRSLPSRALFNIISYGSGGPSTLFETGSVVLNNDSLSTASHFVDNIKVDSHTNLRLAIDAANMMPPHATVPRQVVVIIGQTPPHDLASALEAVRQHSSHCSTYVIVVDETATSSKDRSLSAAQQARDIGPSGCGGSVGDGHGPPAPPFAVALRDAAGSQDTPGSLLVASGDANVTVRLISLLEVKEYAYARNVTLTWAGVGSGANGNSDGDSHSSTVKVLRQLPQRHTHVFVDQFAVMISLQQVRSDALPEIAVTVTVKAETCDPSGTLWPSVRATPAPHPQVLANAVLAACASDESLLEESQRRAQTTSIGVGTEEGEGPSLDLPWCLGDIRTPTDVMAGESISRVKIFQLAAVLPSSAAVAGGGVGDHGGGKGSKRGSVSTLTNGASPSHDSSTASPGAAGAVSGSGSGSQLTPEPVPYVATAVTSDGAPAKQRKRRSGSVFSRAAAAIRRRSALAVLPWQASHAIIAKDRPLIDLIKYQRADGAWDNLEGTAAFLGLKADILPSIMPTYLADIADKTPSIRQLWQTAVAVEYIRMKTVPGFHSRWNHGTQATYRRITDKGHAFIQREITNWSLELVQPNLHSTLMEYVTSRLCESRKTVVAGSTTHTGSPVQSTTPPPASPKGSPLRTAVAGSAHAGSTTLGTPGHSASNTGSHSTTTNGDGRDKAYSADTNTLDSPSMTMTLSSQGTPPESIVDQTESPHSGTALDESWDADSGQGQE